MGGTFDPVHHGHLLAAESARQAFGLSKVVFVPAARPPHKAEKDLTPARHRLAMVLLATLSNPHFSVSDLEVNRAGPSFTVDTLAEFHRLFPDRDLHFITGADAILEITTWRDWAGMLRLARFVAVARPGYPSGRLELLKAPLPADLRSRIHYLEIPGLSISSSDIRNRVRVGGTIRYLLPESVEQYIAKEGLYRGSRPESHPETLPCS